jgi:hypothetical protein
LKTNLSVTAGDCDDSFNEGLVFKDVYDMQKWIEYILRKYTSLVNPSAIFSLVLNPYSKTARTGIKSYRPQYLNHVIDQKETAASPPCGVMDRESTGDTPSVMCPRQAAGYPNNFRNQAIRVSNPEPLKDPAHD